MNPLQFFCRVAMMVVLGGNPAGVPGRAIAQGTPLPLDSLRDARKQLVLDSRVISTSKNVRLVPGRLAKDSRNPLFQADKPWENALNNLYPNLIYDREEGLFKLWYKCVLADSNVIQQMMPPRTINRVGWFLCYATSKDGLAWDKPELGLHGFDGSSKNNIVARDVANVGVFKDPHESDPARRYKMIHDMGVRVPENMRVSFSADGIHWSEPLKPSGLGTSGDTHSNMFWDEWRKKYVLISRLFIGERLVARAESPDFMQWSKPEVVLRSLPQEGLNGQTYCMPVFPYANIYLGFVMIYHATSDYTVDCELVWSPDSIRWERVFPGKPFIPRGPKGSYDSSCIYAQAGSPVLKDGHIWIYYGGSEQVHRGWKRHCLPCLARLPIDRFAGYQAVESEMPGEVVTAPMRCTGDELRVSADVQRGGMIRVAVIDAEGFGLDACAAVDADATDRVVTWNRGMSFSSLKGRTVQLRFALKAATLYAISGVEL